MPGVEEEEEELWVCSYTVPFWCVLLAHTGRKDSLDAMETDFNDNLSPPPPVLALGLLGAQ